MFLAFTTISRLAAPALLLALLSFKPVAPPAAGSMRFKLSGKPYSLALEPYCCNRTKGVASVSARMGAGEIRLAFSLPENPKLPLSYPLGEATAATTVMYYPDTNKAGKLFYWSSKGTLTVTKYDAATRTISGTFSCTGQLRQNLKDVPGSTLQITDGVFTNATLQ
jgi:hypothetical protein